jgi:DNA-binding GntR family transcriptional regulator
MDLASRIREQILAGELVPKQRLVEADLSEEFGASRAAIREALSELAGEGLVERIANRGARVRVVEYAEAIEIAEARRALESLCAGKAAEVITDDEIAELRAIGEAMSRAVDAHDRDSYAARNNELHRRVHEISGQATATGLIRRLRGQNVRQLYRLAQKPGRAEVSIGEHLEIIETICRRDARAAEAAMSAHLNSVIDAMRAVHAKESSAR